MNRNTCITIIIIAIALIILLSIVGILTTKCIMNKHSMLEKFKQCLPKAVKNCLRIEERPPEEVLPSNYMTREEYEERQRVIQKQQQIRSLVHQYKESLDAQGKLVEDYTAANKEDFQAMRNNSKDIIHNLRKAREHSNNSTILQYGIARTLSSIQEDNFLNRGN